MADSFTVNQLQGVFGKFVPVVDEALPLTDDNIQGIFGEFGPVLDEAAAVAGGSTNPKGVFGLPLHGPFGGPI